LKTALGVGKIEEQYKTGIMTLCGKYVAGPILFIIKEEIEMDAKRTIDAIQKLVSELSNQGKIEQLRTYATIKIFCDELFEYAKEKKMPYLYIQEILGELDGHCRSLVDLEDRLGHSVDQHHSWARIAINKLESNHCFGIK